MSVPSRGVFEQYGHNSRHLLVVWLDSTERDSMNMDSEHLQVGIEVEYPTTRRRDHDPLRARGHNSDGLYRHIRDDEGGAWAEGGAVTSDVSVGLEVVSGPGPGERGGIPIQTAPDWYDDTLTHINDYGEHVPVGRMDSSNQTAGLHIHFSHPDTDDAFNFAEWLFDVSNEEWMHVFACSTLADQNGPDTATVFRGDRHVNLGRFNASRTSAVRGVSRSSGHYEWRLPEPMTRENFGLLMEFLSRAADDRHDAVSWARDDIVYQGDSRLTSVQRADAINLQDSFEPDGASIDGVQVVRGIDHQSGDFHDAVFQSSSMPYIYRVHTEDGRYADTYYIMVAHTEADYNPPDGYAHLFPEDPSSDGGRWVIRNDGDSMAVADSDETQLVIDAANDTYQSDGDEMSTTDATDVLLDAIA